LRDLLGLQPAEPSFPDELSDELVSESPLNPPRRETSPYNFL
jgi:hypothetical protein